MTDEGVAAPYAVGGGLVAGAANFLGFKLPALGATIGTRAATGVAGMVGLGIAGRGLEKGALALGGYEKQADELAAFDPTSVALDAVMGGTFGLVQHYHLTQQRALLDGILAAANAKHFVEDTRPVGMDLATHEENLTGAIEALLKGEKFVANEGQSVSLADQMAARHDPHVSETPARELTTADELTVGVPLDSLPAEVPSSTTPASPV